jgi:spermidine/putrescine transport system permease protein
MAFNIDLSGSGGYNPRARKQGRLLALPLIVWLVVFFVVPLLIVILISFMTRGSRGAFITFPLTLENYERIFSQTYFSVFIDSIKIALITTIICLVTGYPLAFFVATRKKRWVQQFTLFLVILPFWTNFLVRTYAWRIILGNEGVVNSFLMNVLGFQEPVQLLFTDFAVQVGLVYGFLPFMVLPIYSIVERFDFRLVEASYDLGANDWRAFWRVVWPLTLPGVIAGCILVFIPAIGSFITPELLGGNRGLMIGTLIQRQFGGTGNWPLGSAASVVMMGIVMLSLIIYVFASSRRKQVQR